MVYVQIALYKIEEHYMSNPFLCPEDGESKEEGKVFEEEHLIAFGRGKGVCVGNSFGRLGWAVDLGFDGRKTVLGSGEMKGGLNCGWMKSGWKGLLDRGDGKIALDNGERGWAKSWWKRWWGGKEKRLVFDHEETALFGDEENSLLV